MRVLGEQRRKRGEHESRARGGDFQRSFPRARLPFASIRLKYAKNFACSAGYTMINSGNYWSNQNVFHFLLETSKLLREITGSRVGAVVRALASNQCGPGSILGPGVICGSRTRRHICCFLLILTLFSLFERPSSKISTQSQKSVGK